MRRNEQGQALLVVLMVMALLVILGTATLTLAHHSKIAATRESEREQAYYGGYEAEQALLAANSGIERAIGKLKIDPLWPDGTNQCPKEMDGDEAEGPCGQGTVEEVKINRSSVTATGVDVTITSTGKCGSAVRKVQAEVRVSYDPFMCAAGITNKGGVHIAGQDAVDLIIYNTPWDYDPTIGSIGYPTNLVFRGGSGGSPSTLTLYRKSYSENEVVYGNVYAGGNVSIMSPNDDGVVVTGDVSAKGTISGEVYVSGNCYQNAGIKFPDFPSGIDPTNEVINYYIEVAQSYGGDHYFDGDHSFTLDEFQNMNGVYFVNGKATMIQGGCDCEAYTGRATIVAKSIEIDGVKLIAAPGNNVRGLVSLENMGVEGSWGHTDRSKHVIILCGGTLNLHPSYLNAICGAVATRGMIMSLLGDEYCTHYLRYREDLFLLYPPGMPYEVKVQSWRQL
ncbi:MAG: hypothetical protein AB1330_00030 [Bacillota bacterium]